MVTWTPRDDIRDKYRGYQKPRYSAGVNVTPNVGQDDRRSSYLRNSYINNVNATREQNAINDRNNNLDYAMSRSPSWYQNRDNLKSIKGVLESTPAVTTDMNESRNMYQMLMNQMKGGDKGARLIDTSGLPAGARRTGRTLFQDPSKSAGFKADLRNMLGDLTFQNKRLSPEKRTSNPAAVRAPEYNPFPKSGFGKEFYEEEFGGFDFGGLMEGIFKALPYTGGVSKIASLLGGNRDREPLERDSRFYPENNVFDINFDEIENIPFMGDELDDELDDEFNWLDAYAPFDDPFNAEQLRSEGKGGLFDLEDNIPSVIDEDITDNIVIKEKPDRDEEVIISEDSFIEPEDSFIESLDEEESFNDQYSFINENPDLTPYEWVMTMVDETGSTMDEVIQNGIFNGILIEN
jgi:hypothetical protein